MRNVVKISVMVAIALVCLGACRNGKAAQEALQVVKKYSGKFLKSAEKEKFYVNYTDDVIRNIEFVKVDCATCDGGGSDMWGNTCEDCEGYGYVYEIKTK